MSKVSLTLIANPQEYKLSDDATRSVRAALESAGARVWSSEWLSEGEAFDLQLSHIEPEMAEQMAISALEGEPVDIIAQPAGNRRKQMLICDMDSTIITIECIDEIADFVGKKQEVSDITSRAMNGELDFPSALAERVALLKGLPEETLAQVYHERLRFMSGAKELVATMSSHGAHTVLVSGGFTFFTHRVKQEIGFALDKSNLLEIADGKLTGKVVPPILDKNAKLQTLLEESARLGITTDDVLAVGDGANDLPMLMAAGLGVAYHAKPNVQKSARHRVNHGDLTALLFIQGCKRSEFIS